MKAYAYGPPSRGLLRMAHRVKGRVRWARHLIAAIVIILWVLLVPPAWLLVKVGEIGHAVGRWCGFESRDW